MYILLFVLFFVFGLVQGRAQSDFGLDLTLSADKALTADGDNTYPKGTTFTFTVSTDKANLPAEIFETCEEA